MKYGNRRLAIVVQMKLKGRRFAIHEGPVIAVEDEAMNRMAKLHFEIENTLSQPAIDDRPIVSDSHFSISQSSINHHLRLSISKANGKHTKPNGSF
ncbi:hypothetical protein E3N88_34983 [Mikania micrantha]|uniref:Uncharacterized protein n=1 Tax=Mikania micrantha TaxID=192012 RepID=A0A5N6M2H5_9ASTR|nr:hypothetical protein E3N88_34983 [Mikania micrantha]